MRRAFGTAYEKDGLSLSRSRWWPAEGAGARARHVTGAVTQPPVPMARRGRATRGKRQHRRTQGGRTPVGLGGLVLPSGAYVVKGDQVRWVPAVDATVVVLASLSLVRVLARTWTRRRRRRSRP